MYLDKAKWYYFDVNVHSLMKSLSLILQTPLVQLLLDFDYDNPEQIHYELDQ